MGHVATPKPAETVKHRLAHHYRKEIRVLFVRKENLDVSRQLAISALGPGAKQVAS